MTFSKSATYERSHMPVWTRYMAALVPMVLVVLCLVFAGLWAGDLLQKGASLEKSFSQQMASLEHRKQPSNCEIDSDLDNAIREYLKPGATLLIGEMHGTEESPQFVRDVACSALRADHKVTLALEIPSQEGPRLQEFLRDGQTEFVDGPFWTSSFQDGRRSIAIRRLIETVRIWREQDYPVRLLTIDEPDAHGEQRESAMAHNLAADIEKHKKDVYVVLTGNIHSRLLRGTPWNSDYAPMGFTLANLVEADTSLVSLDPYYYEGGKAYVCTEDDCGEINLTKQPRPMGSAAVDLARRGVQIEPANPMALNRFHGYYYFTIPVRSSQPAISALPQAAVPAAFGSRR